LALTSEEEKIIIEDKYKGLDVRVYNVFGPF
jgi:hypothetical protein